MTLVEFDEQEHLNQLSLLLRTDTNYESKVMAEFAWLLGLIDRMKRRASFVDMSTIDIDGGDDPMSDA